MISPFGDGDQYLWILQYHLPAGQYRIVFSYLGYQNKITDIDLTEKQGAQYGNVFRD
jgi:hypothetical protein